MENQVIQDDEISLKDVILKLREWYRYLLSKWVIICIAGVVGGLLGLTYAWFQKPVYTADCTFVLEEGGGGAGGLGQYAGLASMVGINIGGGGSNGIFQGDNLFELYKSRLMIEKTLLSPVNGSNRLLIDYYISLNRLRESWNENDKLRNINFSIPRKKFTFLHDSLMSGFVNDIRINYLKIEKLDKKTSIITVRVKSQDEFFAKELNNRIVDNVNKFYIQTKTKNSSENVQILQRQADSVRQVLNASIGGAASAIDLNPNPNTALQILRVPSQRRQIDVQASSAIYSEIVKNLELAKVSLRRESPLIQVVDEPVLPLPKEKFRKITGLLLGIVVSVFLTVIVLAIKRISKLLDVD